LATLTERELALHVRLEHASTVALPLEVQPAIRSSEL
jgi:hypothetical protein